MPRIPSPSTSPCPTPPPESQALSGITLHIIDAKLDPKETGEMYTLAQSTGAKLSRVPQLASVLITRLTMRRRLERHVSWDVNTKHIVSPEWLRTCAQQNKLLPFSQFQTIKTAAGSRRGSLARTTMDTIQDSVSIGASRPDHKSSGDHEHPLSTHRHSPLFCPNQELCLELATLVKARFLEGEFNSELSYSRAIAVRIVQAPICSQIEEYLKTGNIAEARKAAASERFQVLSLLTQVHGVGAAKAREHYAAGRRSLEDLRKFYRAKVEAGTHLGIAAALELHDELNTTIPREEVEAIANGVFGELSAVQLGCEYTICGGYRRGKPYSNDIDIVFTHPEVGTERHLCTKLVDRLKTSDQSAYTSNHEGTHGHQTRSACYPQTQRFPPSTGRSYLCSMSRLLDGCSWMASLLRSTFALNPNAYVHPPGLALNNLNVIFGFTQSNNSKPIVAYSEEEVFSKLNLKYVEPEFRNADV
ncbi:fingers domain of DNA polymerase lambda domain-containing protein [Rhizoctonia solani AG-1 IA]|uniref:DNA polymerase n=1 Tax=Thanatephorus cucumeris (strain AG1-IA) TaxID=983506 RepID=L8X8J4_THACA|nr:fingers domain of DNA polymerase lambda domain-containing protein [Rhizoctonia solani AG-1 IA]